MTLATEAVPGVQQRNLRPVTTQSFGVQWSLDIALDHPDAHFALKSGQGALQQRGLARARRAHQVDHPHPGRVERGPVRLSQLVVLGVDIFENLDPLPTSFVAGVVTDQLGQRLIVSMVVRLVRMHLAVVMVVGVAMVVGMNSAVIMAVETTHQGSPFVAPISETSIAVRVNSSPLTS